MKRYTAKDMRAAAKSFACSEVSLTYDKRDIANMFRQAADDMEREERERKYEYALVKNGVMYNNHYCDFRSATLTRGFGEKVVRREVGEWEEVEDVHQDGGAR